MTSAEYARAMLVACALVMSTVLASCGVSAQDEPVPVRAVATSATTVTPPPKGDEDVVVYFVRDGMLIPVRRSAPDSSTRTALELLMTGPTGAEAADGLQTAIAPQELLEESVTAHDLTIRATRDFTGIAGDNQLLGVAQLVWTVTEGSPDNGVRVSVEGRYIELPTDRGLTLLAVQRSDYASVAPKIGRQTSSSTPQRQRPSRPKERAIRA